MKIAKEKLHSIEARLMHSFGGICERGSWAQCRYLGAWLGLLFYGALPKRRRISQANLHLAFPHLPAGKVKYYARRASQNAAITFCEFLHMKTAKASDLREYSWIEGQEHLEAAFCRGNGAILLTAHLGNWEVMGARAALDIPLSVIARPRSNPALQEHIDSIRSRHNVHAISRFDTGRETLRRLRANEALGILPDQYERDGTLVTFFQHPTRVTTALARLAMISGATVVPAFGIRQEPWLSKGQIVARLAPGFTIEKSNDREKAALRGTHEVLSELERVMTAHPDQWMWMHHRWRHCDGVDPSFNIPEKKMYDHTIPPKPLASSRFAAK
jgi:Kdo2-lipid IVA lauroyltransferase/acyltransferase